MFLCLTHTTFYLLSSNQRKCFFFPPRIICMSLKLLFFLTRQATFRLTAHVAIRIQICPTFSCDSLSCHSEIRPFFDVNDLTAATLCTSVFIYLFMYSYAE